MVIIVDGDKGAANFLLFLLPTDVVEKVIVFGIMIANDPVVVNPCPLSFSSSYSKSSSPLYREMSNSMVVVLL